MLRLTGQVGKRVTFMMHPEVDVSICMLHANVVTHTTLWRSPRFVEQALRVTKSPNPKLERNVHCIAILYCMLIRGEKVCIATDRQQGHDLFRLKAYILSSRVGHPVAGDPT